MKVESQDLWGRMWGPKSSSKPNRMISNNNFRCGGGAIRQMRTRIGLLAQPKSMRSIIGATQ